MHEYSIAADLLERVEAELRARNAKAVHAVHVRVGDLSGADVEHLAWAYDVLREKTSCALAPLHIERVPVRWVCRSCGAALTAGDALRCIPCGRPASLAQGDEIVLARIDLEVDDV